MTAFIDIFVRLLGVVLVLVGMWIGIKVVLEAWDLYRDPSHIEYFAKAVASGSNLDQLLAQSPNTSGGTGLREPTAGGEPQASEDLRPSYFLAWGIALLLLLLVGRLAMTTVKTGADLALHEVGSRMFARTLAKELRQPDDLVGASVQARSGTASERRRSA
ncbi:MAG: hypothetical protein ACREXW_08345 [Gammaproteobacteria bacterium]